MGGNTNALKNLPFAAENVIFFTDESQLPAPIAGVITPENNSVWVMYNDDPTVAQKTVNIASEIAIPDAGGFRITSVGLATCILSYTGTGNFLNTTSDFTGFITIDTIFISCPNGTLYNLTGVLPIGNEFFPRINHIQAGFFDISIIGTIDTISYNINSSAYFDCGQGLILDHTLEALISNVRFTEWKDEANAVQITFKDSQQSAKLSGCVFGTKSNETVFNVTPGIPPDEQVNVTSSVFKGEGSTFTTGTSGTITSIADAASSGTITAAEGTPFGETIFTDTAHGLSEHQIITQSGFATHTIYNDTFEVLEIISLNKYRVHVAFAGTDTGSWDSDLIEITSTAHGLADGTGVQITDTDIADDYNGGGVVFNQTANTYEINRTFNTGSSGNWNTDSLTEEDARVFFGGNTGVKNSMVIGGSEVNANATATVIASPDTYQALDMSTASLLSNAELFILIDAVSGTVRYIGQDEFNGAVLCFATASKSGSTETYNIAVSKNQALPTGNNFAPIEIKTTIDTAALDSPVTLVTNDEIQIMVRGVGTSDNLTFSDLIFTIS